MEEDDNVLKSRRIAQGDINVGVVEVMQRRLQTRWKDAGIVHTPDTSGGSPAAQLISQIIGSLSPINFSQCSASSTRLRPKWSPQSLEVRSEEP